MIDLDRRNVRWTDEKLCIAEWAALKPVAIANGE